LTLQQHEFQSSSSANSTAGVVESPDLWITITAEWHLQQLQNVHIATTSYPRNLQRRTSKPMRPRPKKDGNCRGIRVGRIASDRRDCAVRGVL